MFNGINDEYFDLVEKSDDKMESLQSQDSSKNPVEAKLDATMEKDVKTEQEVKVKKLFQTQFANEKKSIQTSLTRFVDTVSDLADKSISPGQAQGYRNSLQDVSA